MTSNFLDEKLRLVPLEDMISHPLLLTLGWTDTRTVKLMVRAGRLQAEMDSKGYVYLCELSIIKAFFVAKLARVVDLGIIEIMENQNVLCLDLDSIVVRHLVKGTLDTPDFKFKDK